MINLHSPLPLARLSSLGTALMAAAEFQTEFAMRLQFEGLNFVHNRLESDLRCMSALSAAHAQGDVLEVLGDFSEEMVLDYGRETARMFAILAKSAADAAIVADRETALTLDDLAARTVAP